MREFSTSNAAIVMAHPDDEVLWASSILAEVDQIILCFETILSFPEWGLGRKRSLDSFPLPNAMNLDVTEAEVFNGANWPQPAETAYGLSVSRSEDSLGQFSEQRYRDNYLRIIDALRPLLANSENIITHNPWGEYGHEEHVQVFRAVSALQPECGYNIWVTGYVGNKSYPLMLRSLPHLDCGLPPRRTDPQLGEQLKALYKANNCWTWFDDYAWPDRERFFQCLLRGEPPVPPTEGAAINMIWTEWTPPQPRGLRHHARTARSLFSRR